MAFHVKIRVAGKLLNFHTVEYPQSKIPTKLPRSVYLPRKVASCLEANKQWQMSALIWSCIDSPEGKE